MFFESPTLLLEIRQLTSDATEDNTALFRVQLTEMLKSASAVLLPTGYEDHVQTLQAHGVTRERLVDYMFKVGDFLGLPISSVFRAVSVFDRYAALLPAAPADLTSAAAVALRIAAKLSGVTRVPSHLELTQLFHPLSLTDDAAALELRILSTLRWRPVATMASDVAMFVLSAHAAAPSVRANMEKLCQLVYWYTYLSCVDTAAAARSPGARALAAVCCALASCGAMTPEWVDILRAHAAHGIALRDVDAVAERIRASAILLGRRGTATPTRPCAERSQKNSQTPESASAAARGLHFAQEGELRE